MQKNIAQIKVHKDQLFWFLEHTQILRSQSVA